VDGWGFDLEVLHAARRLGHRIETLPITDWCDPKAAAEGLVGDQVGGAAREVFGTLVRLRLGRNAGRPAVLPPAQDPRPSELKAAAPSM